MLPLALVSAAAFAAGPETYVYERIGAAVNPLGLSNDLRFEMRRPMSWEKPGTLFFDGTYAGYGGALEASPAYVRIGPHVSWAPIAFFDVSAEARFVGYYGTYED